MSDTQGNNDTAVLDQKYQGTIESHKAYLAQLQAAFDKHCDQIGEEAKGKLAQIPEENEEARKKVMEEEQIQLNKALAELKQVVNHTNRDVYKKLEDIETQRATMGLNLEEELAQVENTKK